MIVVNKAGTGESMVDSYPGHNAFRDPWPGVLWRRVCMLDSIVRRGVLD